MMYGDSMRGISYAVVRYCQVRKLIAVAVTSVRLLSRRKSEAEDAEASHLSVLPSRV